MGFRWISWCSWWLWILVANLGGFLGRWCDFMVIWWWSNLTLGDVVVMLFGQLAHCDLVGGLEHELYFFHSVGNVIIPTDELIFFRGVGITPTSDRIVIQWENMVIWWWSNVAGKLSNNMEVDSLPSCRWWPEGHGSYWNIIGSVFEIWQWDTITLIDIVILYNYMTIIFH